MRLISGLAVLLVVLGTIAQAAEYGGALQADIRGGYAMSPAGGTPVGLGDLLALPIVKLSQDKYLVATMFATLNDSAQKVPDINAFLVEEGLLYFKPTYKLLLPQGWAFKSSLLAQRSVELQSNGEKLFTDIYDYEEFGLGDEIAQEKGNVGPFSSLSLGLEGVHRDYPNFRELDPTVTQGKNYYTKDYYGLRVNLGGRVAGWSWFSPAVLYQLLLRYYTDNYVQTFNGTLDLGDLAQDQYHVLKLTQVLPLPAPWAATLDLSGGYNVSSQNFFDATASLFFPHYYDYATASLKAWLHWLPYGGEGSSLGLSYQALLTHYFGQPVRDPDGRYTQGLEEDVQHFFQFDARHVLAAHWALVGGLGYQVGSSNQGLQLVPSTYTSYSANLGLQCKY